LLVVITSGEDDREYAVQQLCGGGTGRGCVAAEREALIERDQVEDPVLLGTPAPPGVR
jgi:hypothetical protein